MTLTPQQLQALDVDGYVAPLRLCSSERMATLRSAVEAEVHAQPGPYGGDPWSARHQDCPAVLALCADTAITDAVAAVLGPDLVVWNSVLMHKAPGDGEIPWHQDQDFHYLDPDVGLAVWLALDDTSRDNGCLELIPGTHRDVLPSVPRTRPDEFDSHVDTAHVADRPAFPIELRAGEFLLFHNKLLHRSAANHSSTRRLGLAARYTVPSVRVDKTRLFPAHRTHQVRAA